MGVEEVDIMTKDRPEESVEKKEVLPKASSTPMMKNEDNEMKEKIQEKIPAAAPPPPSLHPPQGREGEIPDRYVEQEDNGNKSTMSKVKGQAGIWRPPGCPVIKCPRRTKKWIHL